MLKIYHYSNKDFKGYIKPDFFGENNYSGNSQRLSGVKRVYFYLKPESREFYFIGAKYCYIAEIKENKLYDINKDPKNYFKRFNYKTDIFKAIKGKGYSGLIGNNGLSCAVLFKAIKIKDRKTLTKH